MLEWQSWPKSKKPEKRYNWNWLLISYHECKKYLQCWIESQFVKVDANRMAQQKTTLILLSDWISALKISVYGKFSDWFYRDRPLNKIFELFLTAKFHRTPHTKTDFFYSRLYSWSYSNLRINSSLKATTVLNALDSIYFLTLKGTLTSHSLQFR